MILSYTGHEVSIFAAGSMIYTACILHVVNFAEVLYRLKVTIVRCLRLPVAFPCWCTQVVILAQLENTNEQQSIVNSSPAWG